MPSAAEYILADDEYPNDKITVQFDNFDEFNNVFTGDFLPFRNRTSTRLIDEKNELVLINAVIDELRPIHRDVPMGILLDGIKVVSRSVRDYRNDWECANCLQLK